MTVCAKCHKEITKEDERKGNYRQGLYPNEYVHRDCPTPKICHICNQEITGKAIHTPLGYIHKGCTWDGSRTAEPTEASPSSWVVK